MMGQPKANQLAGDVIEYSKQWNADDHPGNSPQTAE